MGTNRNQDKITVWQACSQDSHSTYNHGGRVADSGGHVHDDLAQLIRILQHTAGNSGRVWYIAKAVCYRHQIRQDPRLSTGWMKVSGPVYAVERFKPLDEMELIYLLN